MILLGTILATIVSTIAIWLSSQRDVKRRRAAGLQQIESSSLVRWGLLLMCFAPGTVLVGMGNISGFICWLAAITVTGWAIATRKPKAAQ